MAPPDAPDTARELITTGPQLHSACNAFIRTTWPWALEFIARNALQNSCEATQPAQRQAPMVCDVFTVRAA